VSEANQRATPEPNSTLRGQNELPSTTLVVTHPLRRLRRTRSDSATSTDQTISPVRNDSSFPTQDLSPWSIDPHPPRFVPYLGPDRRRHPRASTIHPSRRRTDTLYRPLDFSAPGLPAISSPTSSSAATPSLSSGTTTPVAISVAVASTISASAPADPVTTLAFPRLEAPSNADSPSELFSDVPKPPAQARTVFSNEAQNRATEPQAQDDQKPTGSFAKVAVLQRLTKRRWILPSIGLGILGLLVLGLTKCSSDPSGKADKPSLPSSVETVGSKDAKAETPKVVQRTVVGGRDNVGNGSIATDAITQTPRGIAAFADGRKLISDNNSARIIGRDGRIRAIADPSGLLQKPGAATPLGNDIVVIDQASASIVRIKADGTANVLTNDQQFRVPTSITRLDDKTLIVADPGAGMLFVVATSGDRAVVTPMDVNPPLLRPTAVTHRGDQVLAVVDDADGAIYEVKQGMSRKIAQARSIRAGVSDPITANATPTDTQGETEGETDLGADTGTDAETDVDAKPKTDPSAEPNTDESTAADSVSGESQGSVPSVLILPEPAVAIASRNDGSLWVLGRSSTLLLISANNRGIPSVVSQNLQWPQGLGVDARGKALIADTGAHKVSVIDEKGAIANLAGTLRTPAYEANTTAADDLILQSASGFATTSTGDLIVADESANTIWGITAGGASYRLAGNGTRSAGSDGGQGPDTPVVAPTSLATAPGGSTYFAEPSTGRIRKVDTQGIVTTVFDQFGGPIALPEVAPEAPLEEIGIDPNAPAIAPTTTAAPPSAEVLQERRRQANIAVGRIGLIAVTRNGTLVAVDTWKGTLGTIRDGVFIPKQSLRSQPVGLSVSGQSDGESIAVSEREVVEVFEGNITGTKDLTRTERKPRASGSADSTGSGGNLGGNFGRNFGGVVNTENGSFAVVTREELGPDADQLLQSVSPGISNVAVASTGLVPKVPLSGPVALGALGSLPTGELVQFSANGGLFAQFPFATGAPPSTVLQNAATTASSETSPLSSPVPPRSASPVFRWLTNPPQSRKETTVGRTSVQDPGALASQADGTLIFAENGAGRVHMLRNGNLTILAGSGRRAPAETRTDATTATFDRISALAPHANGGIDFSTPQGLTGIDSVGLVRRNEDPTLASAALTVTSNDETVIVNNRTGLLQRITKSGTFEDLPGTRIINASQLISVGERFYVLAGPASQRTLAVRRGTSETTISLPAGSVPLTFTADEAGTLYVLDTQHRLLRLRQETKADAPATLEKLDGWKVVDTTKLRFTDSRYLGGPDTSDPQAMAVAGPDAVAISDAGTDSVVVVRFSQ
jgi:hypothetical protein